MLHHVNADKQAEAMIDLALLVVGGHMQLTS
jgi:hypothetical protein